MVESLVQQLAGLFRELVDRRPYSEVACVDLAAADAWGRAERLLLLQCDSDDLQLVSHFRRWWVVDTSGLRADVPWPISREMIQREGWEAESPFIKFATNGRRIRFNMKLGARWLVSKEGPISVDGRFSPENLIEEYHFQKQAGLTRRGAD